MKLLVISDIHANIWALDAILKAERDYDMLCCAGDYTDYGIAPAEVISRMREIPKADLVYGNHDCHVLNTYKSGEYMRAAGRDYKWVHYNCQKLGKSELEWLEALPETLFFEADGWNYCIQHQYDAGYGTIESRYAFEEFWRNKTGSYEPEKRYRIIFGHSHRQCVHILSSNMQWLNPGSASYRRPDDPDKTAHYAVIVNGDIELKKIPYDRDPQLQEACRFIKEKRMMETEIQDFMFFFGDAKTSRDPISI